MLYYEDAYMREFGGTIISIKPRQGEASLILDKTAFYPGGGGQPFDIGWIHVEGTSFPVNKVKRESGEIQHIVEADIEDPTCILRIGRDGIGEINWERRYQIMRTHTAMHILCGIIWRDYGASVTGGNMEVGRGRMDFEFERMQSELVAEIEEKCNQEVAAAREVRTQILPREEAMKIPDLIRTKVNLIPESIKEIRTVEIVGLDLQADGGTHVRNTNEVGRIKITDYKSKGAINKRIYLEIA